MKTSKHEHSPIVDPYAAKRRLILKAGAAALAAGFAGRAAATPALMAVTERRLRLFNTHTGEQSDTVYWAEGDYQRDGLAELDRLLRDHRSGDIANMDTGLFDLLFSLSATLDTQQRFHVISGYRSPASNALLHERSDGVAKHSLHMDGLAIDIRVPGRKLADVRRAAIALSGGGVGYYPSSDFVHVDVGRVRTW